MSSRAAFVDDSNETRLSGELVYAGATVDDVLTVQADGSIAAAPGGGSIPDPVTATINVTPTDQDAAALVATNNFGTVTVGGSSSALDVTAASNPIANLIGANDFGIFLEENVPFWAANQEIALAVGAGQDTILDLKDNSGTPQIGFFGKTPADQPAAPVTLEDVVAALQALGLVAT